jgi:hypothetical protein
VDLGFSLKHNRYLLVINLLGIASSEGRHSPCSSSLLAGSAQFAYPMLPTPGAQAIHLSLPTYTDQLAMLDCARPSVCTTYACPQEDPRSEHTDYLKLLTSACSIDSTFGTPFFTSSQCSRAASSPDVR